MKQPKKPLVHPNILGKRELKELYDMMEDIKSNPMSDEEKEELSKLWKIGKYREWKFDAVRMKEIEKQVSDAHTHYGPKTIGKKPMGAGTGTGKRQLEIEREKLIHEIENG